MENETDIYPKVKLSEIERRRNARIFGRIIEAIILPVLIGILKGWGSWITFTVAIIWWGVGIYGLFTNPEDFIIEIILKLFRVID